MGDLIGGIVSAGASLLGGTSTNQKNWDIAQSANQTAQQIADSTNAFNAQQYASRYQTTVKDLESAGLNPMLAYGQGAGSPIPAVQAPVQRAAPAVNSIGHAVDAFNSTRMNLADLKLKEEQANATNAQAETTRTQALQNIASTAKANQDIKTSAAAENVNRAQLDKIAQDIALSKATAVNTSAQTARTNVDTLRTQQEAEIRKPEVAKSKTWWGRNVSPYLSDFSRGASSAASAAQTLAK
jgi:hypothetical protein